MKTLFLLTNAFPYGNWEPYLETEIKYYDQFDKVYIFALQIRKEHLNTKRTVGNNIEVIPILKASNITYLLYTIKTLVDKNLYKEFIRLIKTNRLTWTNIVNMLVFFSRAHYEADLVLKKMKGKVEENSIFYSYRFEYQPYVAILLKKKWKLNSKIVSRAHGYDLYEERHKGSYIPMREGILKEIDYVFPCSEHGSLYLKRRFPQYQEKISVRFLGTIRHNLPEYFKSEKYRIVSCSNVVPVKRIESIIESLMEITDRKVVWAHFGDGPLMNEIKEKAKELPPNIEVLFKGHVNNEELMKVYEKEVFDIFVNVSSSEGIPVSIMEAMSFGIPCIATDVGGTKEVVENKLNGFLVGENCKIEQLRNLINCFINMSDVEYLAFREEARKSWERKYNADKNYLEFSELLLTHL